MKIKLLAPAVLAVLCASAGAQQLYKSVAPDGTVSYSDKPPTSANAKVEKKNYGGGSSVSTDDLPYELANAAKSSPVTLYTNGNCAPCDLGRKMLNERGIPFAEKTVNSNDEINQYTKQMGGAQIPVLMVGRSKLTYNLDQWNSALTSAGYPTTNKMPKSHKNPSAEPLIAQQAPKADAPAAPQASTPAPAPQQPANNGQPGFHF